MFEITSFSTQIAPINFFVTGAVDGDAKDVLRFFALADRADASAPPLLERYTVDGDVEGSFSVFFPHSEQLSIDQFILDTDFSFNEVAIGGVFDDAPVAVPSARMWVEGSNMLLEGVVDYGDLTVSMEYEQQLTSDTAAPRHARISGNVATEAVAQIVGAETLAQMLSGSGELEANIALSHDVVEADWSLQAENMTVDMPLLVADVRDYAVDIQSKMQWHGEQQRLDIANMDMRVGDAHYGFSGYAVLADDVLYVDVMPHRSEFHDASIMYEKNAEGSVSITAVGERVSVAPLLQFSNQEDDAPPFWKQDIIAKVLVDEVQLHQAIIANDVQLRMRCLPIYCETIELSGTLNNQHPVRLSFGPQDSDNPAGLNIFTLAVADAGLLARGLGISSNINGGVLDIYALGSFNNPAQGNIILRDFAIKDAPIFSRLLTVGSFSAMLDLVRGEGMQFDHLKGQFSYQQGQARFESLRARGDAMGITAQGVVDFDQSLLDVKGALSPSYGVNTVLGKIPLVGRVFRGDEGEGVLASRYSIQGSFRDPKVDVNTLSFFTPGVLRELWPEDTPQIDMPDAQPVPVPNPTVPESEKAN